MSIQTTMLHVRVDEQLKNNASEILGGLGLTISDAVRVLLTRIVREQSFPAGLLSDQATYDEWFKHKVEEALADTRPTVSHKNAIARARTAIAGPNNS